MSLQNALLKKWSHFWEKSEESFEEREPFQCNQKLSWAIDKASMTDADLRNVYILIMFQMVSLVQWFCGILL